MASFDDTVDTGAPNSAEALGGARKARLDRVGEGGDDRRIGLAGCERDVCCC